MLRLLAPRWRSSGRTLHRLFGRLADGQSPPPVHHATSSTVQSFLLASSAFICLASSARSADGARCSSSRASPRPPPARPRPPPPPPRATRARIRRRAGSRNDSVRWRRTRRVPVSRPRRLAREEKLPLFRHVLFPSNRVHPAKRSRRRRRRQRCRRGVRRSVGRGVLPRLFLGDDGFLRRGGGGGSLANRGARKIAPRNDGGDSGVHPDPACTPGGLYPAPRSAPEPFPRGDVRRRRDFLQRSKRARDGRKARRPPPRAPRELPERRLPQAIHQARGVFGRGGGGHRRRVSGPGRAGRLARGFGQRQTRRHRLLEFAPFAIRLLRLARRPPRRSSIARRSSS